MAKAPTIAVRHSSKPCGNGRPTPGIYNYGTLKWNKTGGKSYNPLGNGPEKNIPRT